MVVGKAESMENKENNVLEVGLMKYYRHPKCDVPTSHSASE